MHMMRGASSSGQAMHRAAAPPRAAPRSLPLPPRAAAEASTSSQRSAANAGILMVKFVNESVEVQARPGEDMIEVG
jgi:hypothetical protein